MGPLTVWGEACRKETFRMNLASPKFIVTTQPYTSSLGTELVPAGSEAATEGCAKDSRWWGSLALFPLLVLMIAAVVS